MMDQQPSYKIVEYTKFPDHDHVELSAAGNPMPTAQAFVRNHHWEGRPLMVLVKHRHDWAECWFTNGFLHNPYGGPSEIIMNQTLRTTKYRDETGNIYRADGPAVQEIWHNGSYVELWKTVKNKEGMSYREDGPSLINRDVGTKGYSTNFDQFGNGGMTADVPSQTFPIGAIIKQYECAEKTLYPITDDSVAQIMDFNFFEHIDTTGPMPFRKRFIKHRQLFWYSKHNHKRHRMDGPAMIELNDVVEIDYLDGTPDVRVVSYGKNWTSNFYKNDRLIQRGEILKRCKQQNILVRQDHPCHDRPFAIDEKSEFSLRILMDSI